MIILLPIAFFVNAAILLWIATPALKQYVPPPSKPNLPKAPELTRVVIPPTPKKKMAWLSPSQIVNTYENNEINADSWFKGNGVLVRGSVQRIGRDIADHAYLTLTDSHIDGLRRVQAYFDNASDLEFVRVGSIKAVYCRCEGLMMNVILDHCFFPDDEEIGKQYRGEK